MNIFSERLRELREEKQLSMLALAKKIGVSDAAICKWENGTNEPKACYIILLANFFEVSTDYLLGLENESGYNKFSVPQKNNPTSSFESQEIIELFFKLSPDLRHRALTYLRSLFEINEQERIIK